MSNTTLSRPSTTATTSTSTTATTTSVRRAVIRVGSYTGTPSAVGSYTGTASIVGSYTGTQARATGSYVSSQR